jgi:hypothetical protein
MAKLSPVDDGDTYFKYAQEGYARVAAKEKALKDRKSLPLGGKSTKIGEGYIFNKDGSAENADAAAAAYDSNTNNMEAALEDEKENAKLNEARYLTIRRNRLAGSDAAVKAGDNMKKKK